MSTITPISKIHIHHRRIAAYMIAISSTSPKKAENPQIRIDL